jgi:hypothetical protein
VLIITPKLCLVYQPPFLQRAIATIVLKQPILFALLLCAGPLLLTPDICAQKDSRPYLIRYKKSNDSSFRIPLTDFWLVKNADLAKNYTGGWIMKWNVVDKQNSNLLFITMNSTDVQNWDVGGNVSGSVQIVVELPSFKDSLVLNNLTEKLKTVHLIWYDEKLAGIIHFINLISPKDYHIWYNKEQLLKWQKDCKKKRRQYREKVN